MYTVTFIEDQNTHFVTIDSTGIFQIDGVIVKAKYGEKYKINNLNDFRIVRTREVVTHYETGTGQKLGVEEYLEQEQALKQKYDENLEEWYDLESEFKYRKFRQMYTAIYRTVQEISDPIKLAVETRRLESGYRFITSMFSNGRESDIFVYDRHNALLSFAEEKMESLGMKKVGLLSQERSKIQKIYSNATHSTIRYMEAFGCYIFNKDFDASKRREIRGTLDNLIAMWQKDKQNVESIVQQKYDITFGPVKSDAETMREFLQALEKIRKKIAEITVHKGSTTKKRNAEMMVDNLIAAVTSKKK